MRRVKGPDLDGNIVDLGLVSEILIKDDKVYFSITVPAERAEELEPLRQAAKRSSATLPGVTGATAVLTAEAARGAPAGAAARPPRAVRARSIARVQAARARDAAAPHAAQTAPAARAAGAACPAGCRARPAAGVPGVKHLIAVASGKGGVGKSTTAVNLALGFQAIGLKAGILDADIYGPSQPRLLGLTGQPQVGRRQEAAADGGLWLKAMSMGFMVDEGTPIIWRGPMVVSALNQMLREVRSGAISTCSSSTCRRAPATCSSPWRSRCRCRAPSSSRRRRTWR